MVKSNTITIDLKKMKGNTINPKKMDRFARETFKEFIQDQAQEMYALAYLWANNRCYSASRKARVRSATAYVLEGKSAKDRRARLKEIAGLMRRDPYEKRNVNSDMIGDALTRHMVDCYTSYPLSSMMRMRKRGYTFKQIQRMYHNWQNIQEDSRWEDSVRAKFTFVSYLRLMKEKYSQKEVEHYLTLLDLKTR